MVLQESLRTDHNPGAQLDNASVVTLPLREKYPKTKFLIPIFHRPFYFKAVNSCLNFKYTEVCILEYNKSQGRSSEDYSGKKKT